MIVDDRSDRVEHQRLSNVHDEPVGEIWTAEQLEAAGVYEPTATGATERLNLLRIIGARGGTFEQVRLADDQGDLVRLAAELLFLPPGERYTTQEVAERAGVDADVTRRIWQVMGLPEVAPTARNLTAGEVALVQTAAAATELLGEEATMQLLRVLASSMARIADAAVSTFVTTVGADSVAADPHSRALVDANAAARALFDELLRVTETVLRQHFVHAARPNVSGVSPGYESRTMAVGFVDIVDSTALFQWLPLASVGSTMARFEGIAGDVVIRRGGRVVKFAGDDVMFSAPQPADACRIALDIVAAFHGDDVLAGVRGGIALGEVLVRGADCFGAVVNLAARAAKAASPGEVLVDEALNAAVAGSTSDLIFGTARPVRLHGFDGDVVLRSVRRVDRPVTG